ncbi:hypothetical protein CDEST_06303 [Colletotrichum destructivum]|uniref:Uncharacterized protein n=1 Tax=Colletotrichum destructivum TaxID=34406 RepID=A0AAX4ID62_9PEZI|nr:hypothetical protein CDEST_06303 [Colletotrichum destructivum]
MSILARRRLRCSHSPSQAKGKWKPAGQRYPHRLVFLRENQNPWESRPREAYQVRSSTWRVNFNLELEKWSYVAGVIGEQCVFDFTCQTPTCTVDYVPSRHGREREGTAVKCRIVFQ